MLYCVLLAALTCGCGGKYKTYDVTGNVKFADGKPATGMCVTFECADPPISATGMTDTEGNFKLTTLAEGDGAPAGHFRAVISPPQLPDPDSPPPVRIHQKYSRFETSGLEYVAIRAFYVVKIYGRN